jgi:hypothetical protein
MGATGPEVPTWPGRNPCLFNGSRIGMPDAYPWPMKFLLVPLLLVPAWAADTPDSDAARLFDDGQAMLHAGRYGAASVTFRTLLYVYPESDLVALAREELQKSEQLEEQAPKVRSLRYQLGVAPEEILAYFNAREISLAVERPYDAREVERARLALDDLLASKGRKGSVKATVRTIKPHNIEIEFTFEKK